MESALKQRLLGAAVLIALAIIFVPMFLSNSPPKQDSTTLSLDIPPPPERKFETRTFNVNTAAPTSASPSVQTPAAPAQTRQADGDAVVTVDTKAPANFEAPDTTSTVAKPGTTSIAVVNKPVADVPPKPMAVDPPAPSAIPVPVAATPAEAVPSGRFVVNLGIYADQAHADALIAKVKKLGLVAYSESTDYQGKTAQRVGAGPFTSRAAAESARLKIKQTDPKIPSSIIESTDQSKADVPASALPANRAGGWVVQLGAFKSEAEASKLRDRLHKGSVAAFVDRNGSGDQALWRVRAGPYADRAGADSARASIKQKFQIDAVIATQP